jgi:O-antigen/teichoic acid export membrane protein
MAFIGRFMSLILRMQEKGWTFSISQLMPKFIFLLVVGIFIASNSQKDLSQLLTAHAISFFSVAVLFTWSTHIYWRKIDKNITKEEQRKLLKFGLPLVINGIAFWAMTSMDKLFLKHYSSYEELGIYTVTISFAGVAVIVQNVFSTIWAPMAYRWHSEGVDNVAFQKITQQMLLVVIFVFSLMGAFSWVLPYFLPAEYAKSQYIIMACMLYPLLYSLSEVTGIGVGIKRKSGSIMFAMVISCMFCWLCNFVLVPMYGGAGAAVSTGVSFFFYYILKTEISHYYWKKINRWVAYFPVSICVIYAVVYALYGSSMGFAGVALWFIALITCCMLARSFYKKIKSQLV